jgi:hypothetical protein
VNWVQHPPTFSSKLTRELPSRSRALLRRHKPNGAPQAFTPGGIRHRTYWGEPSKMNTQILKTVSLALVTLVVACRGETEATVADSGGASTGGTSAADSGVSSAGGAAGSSAGGAGGGTSTNVWLECSMVPADCMAAACSNGLCGTRLSRYDANMCLRAECTDDSECADGTTCTEIGYGPVSCGYEPSDSVNCICGYETSYNTARICVTDES